jgi:competence protein ComEA
MFRQLLAAVVAAFAMVAAHAAVDANKASQADLETIKGIGPGLSTKILDARKAGAFKDWTDFVDRVGGIGPGNAARFSQHGLTVNSAAYQAAPAANEAKPTRQAPAPAKSAEAARPADAAAKR